MVNLVNRHAKTPLAEVRRMVEMIGAGMTRKEVLAATGATSTRYDRVLFCCRHGLADKLVSGEYAASTLRKMVESGRMAPRTGVMAGNQPSVGEEEPERDRFSSEGAPFEKPVKTNGLSVRKLKQAVAMLEQGHGNKDVIVATGIGGRTCWKLKQIVAARRVQDLFAGRCTVNSLYEEIAGQNGQGSPAGVKNGATADKSAKEYTAEAELGEAKKAPKCGQAFTLLERLALDGIIGIPLAHKLAEVSEGMRQRFIEGISRLVAEIENPDAQAEVFFQRRLDEMDAQIREKERQIREKEQQIRHLDREIACRRSGEAFVRQVRETMTVLRDMELGLSRGDVTEMDFLNWKEVKYHSTTLRRLADVMESSMSKVAPEQQVERLVFIDAEHDQP